MKRAAMFRKREREHVKTVRYFLRAADYVSAMRALAWALQASTAADEAEQATLKRSEP